MGGFDLAFESAGLNVTAQVEIERDCQRLLLTKHPKAFLLDDIRKINSIIRRLERHKPIPNYESKWKRLIRALTDADVWTAGIPCQDWSVAGKRAGLDGARSGLWFAFRRLVALFRPAWVVIENVPGLLSSLKGDCLLTIIRGLEELGYGVSWRSLDAQYFDLAQRRERVFIVASLGSLRSAEVLFERQSLCWDTPPSREAGQRVAGTVAGVSNGGGANGPGRTADDADTLVHSLASEGFDASEDGTGRGTPIVPVTSNPIAGHHSRNDLDNDTYVPIRARRLRARSNSSHREDSETFVLAHGQASAEVVRDGEPSLTCNHEAPIVFHGSQDPDVSGEVTHPVGRNQGQETCIAFSSKDSGNDAGQIAPTLRSQNFKHSHMNGGGQAAIAFQPRYFTRDNKTGDKDSCGAAVPALSAQHSSGDSAPHAAGNFGVRRLTPTECLRLQGYPDGYFDGLAFSDSVKYRMIGNSVAIPVVEWIARRLAAVIDSPLDNPPVKADK